MTENIRIKLTVDPTQAERAFDGVGDSADEMGGRTERAARQASGELIRSFRSGFDGADRAATQFTTDLSNKFDGIKNSIKNALSIDAVSVLQSLGQVTQAAFNTGVEFDSLRIRLNFLEGGAAEGGAAFDYLRDVGDRLGYNVIGLADGFSQLSAATKDTGLEGDKSRKIFEAFVKTGAVLGTSIADVNGQFLALRQIISQGTLQGDEFEQLAERIPGAARIAAKSLGVTTEEFKKMRESGQITADFLVGFADELEKRFGGGVATAAQSARVELAKVQNAFDELYNQVFQRVAPGIIAAMQGISGGVQAMNRNMDTSIAVFQNVTIATGAAVIAMTAYNAILAATTISVAGLAVKIPLASAAMATLTGAVTTAGTAIGAMTALLTGPVGLVIALGLAVGAITTVISKNTQLDNSFRQVQGSIADTISALNDLNREGINVDTVAEYRQKIDQTRQQTVALQAELNRLEGPDRDPLYILQLGPAEYSKRLQQVKKDLVTVQRVGVQTTSQLLRFQKTERDGATATGKELMSLLKSESSLKKQIDDVNISAAKRLALQKELAVVTSKIRAIKDPLGVQQDGAKDAAKGARKAESAAAKADRDAKRKAKEDEREQKKLTDEQLRERIASIEFATEKELLDYDKRLGGLQISLEGQNAAYENAADSQKTATLASVRETEAEIYKLQQERIQREVTAIDQKIALTARGSTEELALLREKQRKQFELDQLAMQSKINFQRQELAETQRITDLNKKKAQEDYDLAALLIQQKAGLADLQAQYRQEAERQELVDRGATNAQLTLLDLQFQQQDLARTKLALEQELAARKASGTMTLLEEARIQGELARIAEEGQLLQIGITKAGQDAVRESYYASAELIGETLVAVGNATGDAALQSAETVIKSLIAVGEAAFALMSVFNPANALRLIGAIAGAYSALSSLGSARSSLGGSSDLGGGGSSSGGISTSGDLTSGSGTTNITNYTTYVSGNTFTFSGTSGTSGGTFVLTSREIEKVTTQVVQQLKRRGGPAAQGLIG